MVGLPVEGPGGGKMRKICFLIAFPQTRKCFSHKGARYCKCYALNEKIFRMGLEHSKLLLQPKFQFLSFIWEGVIQGDMEY